MLRNVFCIGLLIISFHLLIGCDYRKEEDTLNRSERVDESQNSSDELASISPTPNATATNGLVPPPNLTQNEMPSWVFAEVGSSEHPIGILSAFARCPESGIDTETASLVGIRLFLRTNEDEARRLISFFNLASALNSFYRSSAHPEFDQSIVRPAQRFRLSAEFPRIFEPTRGEFEPEAHFLQRIEDYTAELAQGGPDVYYVLSNFTGSDLEGVVNYPFYSAEIFIRYDPDDQEFYTVPRYGEDTQGTKWSAEQFETFSLNRIEPPNSNNGSREFRFGADIDNDALRREFSELRVSVPIDDAREFQYTHIFVVHSRFIPDPLSDGWALYPLSIELRNACSSESYMTITPAE